MALLDFFQRSGDTDIDEPDYYGPLKAGDYASAIPLLRSAMRGEDSHAMAIYASLLAMGRGVEKNLNDAIDWFRQSAVRGDPAGQTAFGACLAGGTGIERNDSEAAYWLYRAASDGYLDAADLLSDVVMRNQSVVGEHFSMGEFTALMRARMRVMPHSELH